MRILDRYIVREVFRHALLGLVVFTFVFFVPQLIRLMELFVRHSGSGAQVLKLFLCIFPAVFVFTVPMATLIGARIPRVEDEQLLRGERGSLPRTMACSRTW